MLTLQAVYNDFSINNDVWQMWTIQARAHCRVAVATLSTLAGYIDWVFLVYITSGNCRLLESLCLLLSEPELQLEAAECLLIAISRKVPQGGDLLGIVIVEFLIQLLTVFLLLLLLHRESWRIGSSSCCCSMTSPLIIFFLQPSEYTWDSRCAPSLVFAVVSIRCVCFQVSRWSCPLWNTVSSR